MAGGTFFLESAVMGVGVAGCAGRELQSPVFRGLVRSAGQVTLGACNLGVQAGQGISRLGMIEAANLPPRGRVMTGTTIVAELAFVKIFMARQASWRKSQETPVQVFLLDQLLPFRLDARGGVAILALDDGVLAVQNIASLVVVKFFLGRLPADELEALSVVLGMAASTVFVGIVTLYDHSVKSLIGGQALIDFSVTLQAFETAACGREPVATGALSRA